MLLVLFSLCCLKEQDEFEHELQREEVIDLEQEAHVRDSVADNVLKQSIHEANMKWHAQENEEFRSIAGKYALFLMETQPQWHFSLICPKHLKGLTPIGSLSYSGLEGHRDGCMHMRNLSCFTAVSHKVQGRLLPSRTIRQGVDMGRSFSVYLFCLAMDPLFTYLNRIPGVISVQGYIDDTAIPNASVGLKKWLIPI